MERGQQLGNWTVVETLGEGGMARVYKVRHDTLDKSRALKVLTTSDAEASGRLLKEAYVQANLEHPNIVEVLDLIPIGGSVGLLMAWIDGPQLDVWLTDAPRSLAEREAAFKGIVRGVAAAHARGWVHRDLKPQNILMAREAGRWVPKITDFGLVRWGATAQPESLADQARTRAGQFMGTPAYMAPEQIYDASSADERSDIYALGCILYHLCCGAPPFEGSVESIARGHISGGWRPPRERVPELPEPLVDAIEQALRLEPAERPGSCEALLAILGDSTASPVSTLSPPAVALPVAVASPPREGAPRGRSSAWLGAGLLLAAVAVLAVMGSPNPTGAAVGIAAVEEPVDAAPLSFIDSDAFDAALSEQLAREPAEVMVEVPFPFDVNDGMPRRMNAWISAVKSAGGRFSVDTVEGHVLRGAGREAWEVALEALGHMETQQRLAQARGYDVLLLCTSDAQVLQVVFRRR